MLPVLTALLFLALAPPATPADPPEADDQAATLKITDGSIAGCGLAEIGFNSGWTSTAAADRPSYTGPFVTISPDCETRCDLGEFAKAAREVASHLSLSDDVRIDPAIYRTPAAQLRSEADEIERRDAAIRSLREQLDRCGWMAESGAFDR